MECTPFTLDEATEIREDFEDLIDTEFKIGSSPLLLVADIVIAPFLEADKESFIENYAQSKNSPFPQAPHPGSGYDVILVTLPSDDETNYSYIDIRRFADLKGIKYSFPA